ncbi:uncharacterized protein LOC113149113 isoform X2 [Anabas testudineus]|uniref:uncharacterized protein LOC113149113 isoform X2 n=1 Tax=Anabas testudineus TaxID=64144 RepID=UPI000E45712A|nr:uncharacterized protein LOC113149113 isoform X2 [Anabas testudineus]
MAEFRWIQMFFFLILILQFTASDQLSFTVRDGGDVSLPCKQVMNDQDKCDTAVWLHQRPKYAENSAEVELVKDGQIDTTHVSRSKSDRLSVTENCSLVIKKVTDEDVGRYICRNKSQPKSEDGLMYLFVVNISQQNSFDRVGFTCSVLGYGDCRHSVKWFHQRTMITDLVTSQNNCSVTEYFMHTSVKYESLKCEVTDSDTGSVHQFPLRPPSSDETTTKTTTENTTHTVRAGSAKIQAWWWLVCVTVGLSAVIVTVIAVRRYQTNKGRKKQMNGNTDPEDGVSYASISYTRNTNSKAQVKDEDDDEGDAVTYSTVKTSSSSAGASTDPSDLYANIN